MVEAAEPMDPEHSEVETLDPGLPDAASSTSTGRWWWGPGIGDLDVKSTHCPDSHSRDANHRKDSDSNKAPVDVEASVTLGGTSSDYKAPGKAVLVGTLKGRHCSFSIIGSCTGPYKRN